VAEGDELNQEALNALRTALDDLLIVDVVRKPAGLSDDLKAGEDFLKNKEALDDLIAKGFAPVGIQEGAPPEILSSEGEAIVTLRDGVEYVLRFGKLRVQADAAEGDAAAAAAAEGDAAAADAEKASADQKNLRRYLFVMARFNEDSIQKPELQELPPLPEGGDEENAEGEAAAADDASAEEKPAEENAVAEQPAEGQAEEDKPADAQAVERDAALAERKRVEDENKRLQDEYNDNVEKGKKRVAELNDRFGDWYYVISNDVFKKIHLGRKDVVRKKPAPGAGAVPPAGENPLSGLPNLPGASAAPADEPAAEAPAAEPAAEEPAAEAPADSTAPGDDAPLATPSDESAAPPAETETPAADAPAATPPADEAAPQ
jgi:hypothetical protein